MCWFSLLFRKQAFQVAKPEKKSVALVEMLDNV